MNDFKEQNKFSHENDIFWDKVYKQYFPTMVSSVSFPNFKSNPLHEAKQLVGIDREITLENGKVIKIDEKLRTVRISDIMLEYISNDNTGSPGWIEKDLDIDFIAYGSAVSKKVYMLPWKSLKKTWGKNKEKWKKIYGISKSPNPGHFTLNVPVPLYQLLEAMYVVYLKD